MIKTQACYEQKTWFTLDLHCPGLRDCHTYRIDLFQNRHIIIMYNLDHVMILRFLSVYDDFCLQLCIHYTLKYQAFDWDVMRCKMILWSVLIKQLFCQIGCFLVSFFFFCQRFQYSVFQDFSFYIYLAFFNLNNMDLCYSIICLHSCNLSPLIRIIKCFNKSTFGFLQNTRITSLCQIKSIK